ncbi:MAG: hypothetical protein HYY44_05685 [Deltaproteobacteria bacterium]|nr:hypothetical protein [Deltaproteobacteria bacterium]MBI4373267.1 hypothetical protein [Deltaproteobacteria bacterium]
MKKISVFIFLLITTISFKLFALETGYKNGLFFRSDDDQFELKTNLQIQPQYQFVSIEGQGKTNGFQSRRTRLALSGHLFSEDFKYRIEFEPVAGRATISAEASIQGGPNLRDAFLELYLQEWFAIRAGQFKTPYNREELTASWRHQLVDLSLANEVFSYERDIGLTLFGNLPDKKLEYALFAMNEGNNRNVTNNNNELLLGGRLLFNIAGDHGYTMSDVDHSEEVQLALGLASSYNKVANAPATDQSLVTNTADIACRYLGASFLGEWHFMRNTTTDANTYGFMGQAGYFLIPEKFEAAARFAGVVPAAAGVANGYESTAGLNYFFHGHNLKLQTDYSVLWNSPLTLGLGGTAGTNGPNNIITIGGAPGFNQNQNDHRVRTQVQLVF